jgi:hypothetical protein
MLKISIKVLWFAVNELCPHNKSGIVRLGLHTKPADELPRMCACAHGRQSTRNRSCAIISFCYCDKTDSPVGREKVDCIT